MSKVNVRFIDGIPEATEVIDTLDSDKTTASLSAKQGKALKALVDGKITPPPNDGKVYCFYQNEWIELRGVEIKEE